MTSQLPRSAVLAAEEQQRILAEQILPDVLGGTVPQQRPVALVVAGQTGAGKSTLAASVKGALDGRGGAAWVCSDRYKPLHPAYELLLERDDREVRRLVRSTVRAWQQEVEAEVRRRRCDVVVESALVDLSEYRRSVAAYRADGYPVELVVVSAAEPWSQLGIVERFLAEGRWVGWRGHDDSADALMAALVVIERERLADRVTVVDRDGVVLYANTLTEDGWQRPSGAAEAVADDWERPWSAAETWRWRHRIKATERRLGVPGMDEDRALAVSAEVERALALAEPVRRLSQINRGRPGVDFHRLSRRQHDRTFEQFIAPAVLARATAAEQPRAVLVLGQLGTERMQVAAYARRALGKAGAAMLARDDLESAHPDYGQLVAAHPRTAPDFIRADVDAWQQQLDRRVREAGLNTVINASTQTPDEVRERAAGYRRAGYGVDLVLVAARAADSRQQLLSLFAYMLRLNSVTYLPSVEQHDAGFAALAELARSDEGGASWEALLVVDQSGRQLHRCGVDQADGAVRALEAERGRPYGAAEAERFAAVQRRLRGALPQYRGELEQIAALARPLLPPVPRLVLPAGTVRDLPLPARRLPLAG